MVMMEFWMSTYGEVRDTNVLKSRRAGGGS